ncbi:MAG: helix-turn-helix domain-containing protein [Phascolarctobacterium sp.]|uniref:helix-turn-helix domain-containing protein n=1 Tax=Phascolarctobacterium sp. TaxID=2049039 RepID=UPI0026DD3E25|nr:helix-turn-helix domain-containing protein [Phascolarctobacterium sp.]MDO4921915.1 helix-turn-helix domain-containing protein [Phascolarctobacterium sp.]
MQREVKDFLDMLRKEIGESIIDRRRKKRIRQQELAAMCGISQRMLRLVESGEQRYGLDIYLLISIALELEPEALLAESVQKMQVTGDGRERLEKEREAVYVHMQKRLEGYRKGKERWPAEERRAKGSQEAETKAKGQPKGLARGGRCARIYVA